MNYQLWSRLRQSLMFGIAFFVIQSHCQCSVAQDNKWVASDKDGKQVLVVQMYQVDDLLDGISDQAFKGFILPGVFEENSSGITLIGGDGGLGSGGGQGGGGFGGGSSGSSSSGGGVFRVAPSGPMVNNPVSPTQFGGGGGGFGGGMMFNSPPADQQKSGQLSIHELVDAIESTVAVDTWESSGGHGSATILGTVIVISQTATVHQQVDAFLKMLRQIRKTDPTSITIKAIWLTINESQLESLAVSKNQAVDVEILRNLAAESGRRGQVVCFDRQTVHIAAGNLKSSVESVVPVVGQLGAPLQTEAALPTAIVANDRPGRTENITGFKKSVTDKASTATVASVIAIDLDSTQATMQTSAMPLLSDSDSLETQSSRTVGYQPVTRWINYGTVLQVTPVLSDDHATVTIEVASISIWPNGVDSVPARAGGDDYPRIDRHDLNCQQFQTSAQLKDSKPMLIGGSAIHSADGSKLQTYLILEAIVGD